MANCNTCKKPVKQNDKIIICSKCDGYYHQRCVKINAAAFEKIKKNANSKWKCRSCLPNKGKSGKAIAEAVGDRSDVNKFSDKGCKHRPEDEASSDGKGMVNDIGDELQNILRIEVRNVIQSGFDDIKSQVGDFKTAAAIEDIEITNLKTKLKSAQRENIELRTKISDLMNTMNQLNANIAAIDQSMRETNIEIFGLPEPKYEVLPAIVMKMAAVVSSELKDCDILKCVRVASNKFNPRSVVVKLRSVKCRDELYAAVVRYNNEHPNDPLNTTVLRYSGRKMPVEVTEHRSPMHLS